MFVLLNRIFNQEYATSEGPKQKAEPCQRWINKNNQVFSNDIGIGLLAEKKEFSILSGGIDPPLSCLVNVKVCIDGPL